jgi:membrane protease YdiL (CAAX protease family)
MEILSDLFYCFLNSFFYFLIIVPFVFILMEKNKENYYRVLILFFCFISYYVILSMSYYLRDINFLKNIILGSWNWYRKFVAILWGVLCYLVFRKYLSDENNFFTIKQDKKHIKSVFIISMVFIVLQSLIWLFYLGKSELNIEILLFNLIIPGIDEEIFFRGIFLGLLMCSIKKKIIIFDNPSLLITALLFGLVHGFSLGRDFSIKFYAINFLMTCTGGYIFGWIAIKTKSIFIPIVVHNLANFISS